ncbi:MAG: HTH domain-containing protein [Candidatus Nomurabacteria bacterium]|nr:HTH domain-containing protein [Candidatus Nomurabacteria bacterium]
MGKIRLTFRPKQATKKLLKGLKDRDQYVISNRFGLETGERRTLESIGQEYGITRERVRQIENYALNAIRKSESFEEAQTIFEEIKTIITDMGGVVGEDSLLSEIGEDEISQNHIHLYLVLGDQFTKQKENNHFKHRWIVDNDTADKVHDALLAIRDELSKHDLVPESDILKRVADHLEGVADKYRNDEHAGRFLNLSKSLGKNPLGEWGRAESPAVRTRGIKDYAYLVMRRHGSPMHFREVAKSITETFDKKTHVATTHNELIKDPRFVLVGRGLYGLGEWGYKEGVVRDVIKQLISEHGPMNKDEIVDRVLKERYLKRNTILVNLMNNKHFKKTSDGKYDLA